MGAFWIIAAFLVLASLASANDRQIAIIARLNWKPIQNMHLHVPGKAPVTVFTTPRRQPWGYVFGVPKDFEQFEISITVNGKDFRVPYATKGKESAESVVLHDGEHDQVYPSVYVLETSKTVHDRDIWAKFIKTDVFPRIHRESRKDMEKNLPRYWAQFQSKHLGISLFLMGDGFAKPDEEKVANKEWLDQHTLKLKYTPVVWSKSFHTRTFSETGLFARINVQRESGMFSVRHRNLVMWESAKMYSKFDGHNLEIKEISIPIPVHDSDNDDENGLDPAASGDAPRLLIVPFTSNAVSEKFWRKVDADTKGRYWDNSRWNLDEIRKLWSTLRKEEPKLALDNLHEGADEFEEDDTGVNRKMKAVVLGVVVLLALCAGAAYFMCCPSDGGSSSEDSSADEESQKPAAQTNSEWPLKDTVPKETEFASSSKGDHVAVSSKGDHSQK